MGSEMCIRDRSIDNNAKHVRRCPKKGTLTTDRASPRHRRLLLHSTGIGSAFVVYLVLETMMQTGIGICEIVGNSAIDFAHLRRVIRTYENSALFEGLLIDNVNQSQSIGVTLSNS